MKREINLFIQYKTWDLIFIFNVKLSYYLFKSKYVYKIK